MKLIFPQRRLGVIDRRVTAESCIDQCPTCGGVCDFRPLIRCVDNSTAQPFGGPLPCFVRPGDARTLSSLVIRYGGSVSDVDGFWRVELIAPVILVPFVGAPPRDDFSGWGGTGRFRFESVTGQTVEATCCIHLFPTGSSVRISSPCGFNPCPSDPRIPFRDGSAHPFHALGATTAFGSARTGCQSLNAANVPNLPAAVLYRSGPGAGQQAGWSLDATATPTGSLIVCPTSEEFGACCFPDGTCSLGQATACNDAGGVYMGEGSGCDACAQTGACCAAFQNPGGPADNCRVVTATACAGVGGAFRGVGSACAGQPCPTVGRCCLPNGGCAYSNENACILNGGTWTAGGVCGPGACPGQVGACCLPNQSCVPLSESACQAQLGTWRGAGVACPPTGQCLNGYLSACCISWNDGADHVRCFENVTCNECQAIAGSIVPPGTFPTVRCGIAAGQTCQDINCVPTGRPLIQPDRRIVLASTVPGGCAGCKDGGR